MEDEISQYFQSINPIARRVWVDIETCKESYEDAWNYLSSEEQDQVINENIIHPEAILKYSPLEDASNSEARKQSQRRRIIEDDLGARWEDEHAAPFSWFTQSQLSLAKEGHVRAANSSKHEKSVDREPPITRTTKLAPKPIKDPQPVVSQPYVTQVEEDQPQVETLREEMAIDNITVSTKEPEDDVATGDALDDENDAVVEDSDLDIPRTGFAFLDNW